MVSVIHDFFFFFFFCDNIIKYLLRYEIFMTLIHEFNLSHIFCHRIWIRSANNNRHSWNNFFYLYQSCTFLEQWAMADYEHLKKDENFWKWFWNGQNGNELIEFLNSGRHNHDKIRREKNPPFVYGLIFNGGIYKGEHSKKGDFNDEFKVMKIGLTQCKTDSNEDNRMKQIISKFKKNIVLTSV